MRLQRAANAAAEDNYGRIDGMRETGYEPGYLADHLAAESGTGIPFQVVSRRFCLWTAVSEGRTGKELFRFPAKIAGVEWRVAGFQKHVTQFAGIAVRPTEKLAVDDYSTADACAESYAYDDRTAFPCAEFGFRISKTTRIIF